uniref:Uncharacterized protein n=1 Tax=Podoviridae sp. ctZkC8 TaxID=2825259 RepID=A0A8S5UC47_9CAUD|nr:MAG TPA: hypothetical protein [Podoviridae sp. ctZkC8]
MDLSIVLIYNMLMVYSQTHHILKAIRVTFHINYSITVVEL